MNTHSCGARWTGSRPAHCAGCHQTFSGTTAFDAHRRDGACITPEAKGLIPEDNAHGTTVWHFPGSNTAHNGYADGQETSDD